MMTCIMPLIQATSVPRFWPQPLWACSAILMRRGSTTISLGPLNFTARLTKLEITGWFSVVLEPVIRMTSAFSMQPMVLVIAPLPNAAARPATVEECQRRAQ
jgi:hypothetical protein